MQNNQTNITLKRSFGMREAITITVGTVVGVGLFTVGANVVGMLGSAVIFATFLAMLVSVYPALLYAEMGSTLPYAGGTYKYASLGLNRVLGMLAGWNFIISLVAVTSGEALAFSFYFRIMFNVLGIDLPISDIAIACIIVGIFIIASIRGVEITGRLQNASLFFFWGIALIWFVMMLPNLNLGHFVQLPDYVDFGAANFIGCVALIWWCFAGFETCCAMGEEIKYPHINIPRALFLSPLIVFAVNAIFQWFLVGIVPTEQLGEIISASAPYAEAMTIAGILGFPLFMLAAGIAFGGDFSTLNASIAVPPRYLFTIARDGVMPKIFAKLHSKYQTPYVAITTLGLLSIALIATGSMIYISSLSLFADLFYYVIGISAALGLRIKRPDLVRPYKAPFIKIGVPISIIAYLIMMSQLDNEAFWSGIIWCILGLIIYYFCQKKYGSTPNEKIDQQIVQIIEPSILERQKMDKEFRIWRNIVCVFVIIAITIYLLPLLIA